MGAIVLLQAGMSEKGTVTQQATHPAQRSKEYLASATALAVWILYTYIYVGSSDVAAHLMSYFSHGQHVI